MTGGDPTCFDPVELRGNVFDGTTSNGIGGALVVAIDANGAPVSDVVTTDSAGNYSIRVPATRNADGTIVDTSYTLRVTAQGYLPFPKPPRYAIAISIGGAVQMGSALVVDTVATDVSLLPVMAGGPTTYSVAGTVSGDGVAGALVIAEQGGVAVATAIVGVDGKYTLFNVPAGATTIRVVRGGIAVPTVDVNVTGNTSGVDLAVDTSIALGTVNGSLNFVDASNGDPNTSVILVPVSTFDPIAVRGEAPAGLRVVVPTSGSTFSITGVPPGDYVVLAAFENDNLVRDPDETQGGTAVLTVTVAAGATVDAGSFKITNALNLVAPLGTIATLTPNIQLYNDPSANEYWIHIYDAYGTDVCGGTVIVTAGSGNQLTTYPFPAACTLMNGGMYQIRVFSRDTMGNTFISASEDLEGVFTVAF